MPSRKKNAKKHPLYFHLLKHNMYKGANDLLGLMGEGGGCFGGVFCVRGLVYECNKDS